jgi:hypothetical protein
VRIHGFSGEGLEQMSRERFVPVIFRARPDFRLRMSLQEMGSRAYSVGPHRNVRTERLAAKTSGDDVMVVIVHVAGETIVHQRDRFAELAAGAGVLSEGVARGRSCARRRAGA